MPSYYNEIDPFKAAWLRELIKTGAIARGDVDERNIKDVQASDLEGFTQCHFFAGIGVWSYALRLAGWPDDRSVWTGSCPCPSFSAAGKGEGFADPRHLWPDWFRLARERRPATIFGEQVDDAIGHGWLDLVQTDPETADYAVGKAVFGACSVGAPHIRQRLYFGANYLGDGLESRRLHLRPRESQQEAALEQGSILGGADTEHAERRPQRFTGEDGRDRANGRRSQTHGESGARSKVCERSDSASGRFGMRGNSSGSSGRLALAGEAEACSDALCERGREIRRGASGDEETDGRTRRNTLEPDGDYIAGSHGEIDGPLRGHWRDAIWLPCTDGKYRPTQPGLFPLAHGAAARVGRLRGYGDAIVAQQAQAFIESFIEATKRC